MTFEEWLGDRIETMSSHEYAAEKAAWEAGQKSVLDCAYEVSLATPKGYVLVPVEPTEALHSDTSEWERGYDDGWSDAKARYAPEGYVLVPVEPTENMVDEGEIAYVYGGTIEAVYKAMIQAAQEEK